MQTQLSKFLIHGEGDHYVNPHETRKEDGLVATLVIQLPSLYEGGGFVVSRHGEVKNRHEFGKAERTDQYMPHYAAIFVDADFELEKVTKGYRLTLIYSIQLPASMYHLARNDNSPLSEGLARAFNSLNPDDACFAALLTNQYTSETIEEFGAAALKDIDYGRLQVLEEGNAFASPDKKLRFFLVELKHHIAFAGDSYDWDERKHNESTTWYSFIDGLDKGPAQQKLLTLAVEKATKLESKDVQFSIIQNLFWKLVIRSDDSKMFETTATKCSEIDPSQLGPVVDALLQHVGELARNDERVAKLKSIIGKRIEWLKHQIKGLETSFTWHMPRAEFEDNSKIQEFVRGPDMSMKTTTAARKFKSFQDARNYAAKWTCAKKVYASFRDEANSSNGNAIVTITKTMKYFRECQFKLQRYKLELERRLEGFHGDTVGNGCEMHARGPIYVPSV